MKKYYIIQAHKNPEQLERLIDRLMDKDSFFFIHIDKKSDIEAFRKRIRFSNVKFIEKRVNCIWADYSQVTATLNLIEEVLKMDSPGYILFLSGQDYPVKSNADINGFLEAQKGYDFISFDSKTQPVSKKEGHFYHRLKYYKINLSDRREDFVFAPPFSILPWRFLQYAKVLARKKASLAELFKHYSGERTAEFCKDQHYRGSNWWVLRSESAAEIYSYYLARKRDIDAYYRHTFCADEQFFQTLYALTQPLENARDFLHYVDWSNEDGETPTILKARHFDVIKNLPGDKLFARKFDTKRDKEILDLIDREILQVSSINQTL